MTSSQSLFETLPGEESFKNSLRRMLERGSLGQSLLFSGPENAAAEKYAKELALHWLDPVNGSTRLSHPDLKVYAPEGKLGMHTIESMRKFSEEVYLSPYEAKGKAFILLSADRMLPTSANALLKTFEEPANDALIILVAEREESLLTTVLSRCQKIRFKGDSSTSHKVENPLIENLLMALEGADMIGFKEVKALASLIGKSLEKNREEKEKSLLSMLKDQHLDKPTAVQEAAFLKEAEGAGALAMQEEARLYFEAILMWTRDQMALLAGASKETLFYVEREGRYLDAIQRGKLQNCELVSKAISDARLSLGRSTSPTHCFETLFLKLL